MEIALPIVALGAMYVVSNQKKEKKSHNSHKEGFDNVSAKMQKTLPNTTTPAINYPVQNKEEIKHAPDYYPSPNAATDRYYQQTVWEKEAEKDKLNTYTSLTGEEVSKTDMKHNNMQPFFGSKVTQRTTDFNNSESILDNMQGSGSQQFRKREQAPLFKPQENMQWAHGTPNQSDFIQSRMNPGRKMANVKPWQEVRVGPGLNKGYSASPSGGFNSGMESRDAWIAKTVDQLRIKTNPKVTYGGVILGGKRDVTNRGIHGNVEKNRPDTFYINTPERYFTTTGQEKAQTARALQVMPEENRATTTRDYYGTGNADGAEASYVPGKYQASMRVQLDPYHVTNAHAADRQDPNSGDYGRQGYKLLPNERSLTTERQPNLGAVASFAKAVVAPLMDILRPSRKENVIGNLRPTGNAHSSNVTAGYVYNPANRARTTTRETTASNPYQMNVGNSEIQGYGYLANPQQSVNQNRDDTTCHYIGNAGRTEGTSNATLYNAAYNANLNPNKEVISKSRINVGNQKIFNGESFTNIQINKLDGDRDNNRVAPSRVYNSIPNTNTFGQMTARSEVRQGINCERTSGDILNAFNKNPYTKPLYSVA